MYWVIAAALREHTRPAFNEAARQHSSPCRARQAGPIAIAAHRRRIAQTQTYRCELEAVPKDVHEYPPDAALLTPERPPLSRSA